MRDNLAASFVLMAGAAFLGYWFYHLTGPQRAALLAKGRAGGGDMGGLAPYVPQATAPTTPSGGLKDSDLPFKLGDLRPGSRY